MGSFSGVVKGLCGGCVWAQFWQQNGSKFYTSRTTIWRTSHAIEQVLCFCLNPSYTRPGHTIWRTFNAIVKVLCWFESKLYTSRTYNGEDRPCNCDGLGVGLNLSYTRPGRTIWRTSNAIVKVLCWFESKLYTSRTYNQEGLSMQL